MSFKKNETKKLTFDLDNIYGNKEYVLSAQIASDSEVEVYDEWNNILSFSNDVETEDLQLPVINPGKLTVESVR